MWQKTFKPLPSRKSLRRPWFACWAVLLTGVVGCHKPSPQPTAAKTIPQVAVVSPTYTELHWTVRQPGYIEAFEETAIVPKIAGYIETWNVDIGDRVKKGEVLAVLWVPDMVKDLDQKRTEVEQARKLLEVVEAHVASTATLVEEAKAGLHRCQANLKYRQMQYDRVSQLHQRSVVNKEVEDEALNELRASEASVREAEAKVEHAQADRMESEAVREKCRVDIAVAQAAFERVRSLVNYSTLRAPFDGVISQRNINTGDFVQPPATGQKAPLYVVQRRDLMRVFVEVPEADAVWVKDGTPARVRIPILKGGQFVGSVKRMSYSLKRQTRTLLAEIDLANPEDLLRPGMFASAAIRIERTHVLTLPATAVATQGDVNEGYQDFCFVLDGATLHQMPVEVGTRGEGRVQVLKKLDRGNWVDFSGEEKIVRGELSSLVDGQEVGAQQGGLGRRPQVARSTASGADPYPG
jgi:HlyD family secretion protein